MSLDVNTGGSGNIRARLNHNAKADKWFYKGKEKEDEPKEIQRPTVVMDMKNVATGWIYFDQGKAPLFDWDPALGTRAEQSNDNQKRGFRVCCYSSAWGEEPVELTNNGATMGNAFNNLYKEVTAADEYSKGQLPIIEVTGADAIQSNYGTNYAPTFKIKGWTDRAEYMVDEYAAAGELNQPQAKTETKAAASGDNLF